MVKFLQCIVACVLQPSMFTQITVRLVSSFVEKSGGLGGWGVRHDFLAVWSAGMISSAINTLMALEESGPFLSHLFIVTNPSWVLRDPLASSLLVPGQILV